MRRIVNIMRLLSIFAALIVLCLSDVQCVLVLKFNSSSGPSKLGGGLKRDNSYQELMYVKSCVPAYCHIHQLSFVPVSLEFLECII